MMSTDNTPKADDALRKEATVPEQTDAHMKKLDENELDEVSGGKYQEYVWDSSEPTSHSKRARGRLMSWVGNQSNILNR